MKAPTLVVEVHSREELAAAARQHAGTSCRIVWGSFQLTFQELAECEKVAVKVLCRHSPNIAPRWEWEGSAYARAHGKKSSRRRVPFVEDVEDFAAAWEKMPRKNWPKN